MCKGITKNITKCQKNGTQDGYCKTHAYQAVLKKNIEKLNDDEIWEYYNETWWNRNPIQTRDTKEIYRIVKADLLNIISVKYKLYMNGEINGFPIYLKKIKSR